MAHAVVKTKWPICKKCKNFISALKSPIYIDFMIKKLLKSKTSKSHTWAPLNLGSLHHKMKMRAVKYFLERRSPLYPFSLCDQHLLCETFRPTQPPRGGGQKPELEFLNLLLGAQESIPSLAGRCDNPLTYLPARLNRLAESIPWNRFLGFLNFYKYGLS